MDIGGEYRVYGCLFVVNQDSKWALGSLLPSDCISQPLPRDTEIV